MTLAKRRAPSMALVHPSYRFHCMARSSDEEVEWPGDLRSTASPFRCLAVIPPEESTKAQVMSGCPSLDGRSRDAEAGFEPRTFRSLVWASAHSNRSQRFNGPKKLDFDWRRTFLAFGRASYTRTVDQVAVDLFAELGNWLANVSSPHEETSSVRSWVGTSCLFACVYIADK
ncbi:hypothetical protein T265_10738 [Opisthorchis viverrini]|uniref:Uncharacterized protein n=1 Tax=Opisthorchis viverrini TaxID=6198 RepID=A0A074ZC65_OPIVI|nr:hypothetical protein T265_10738 [Opisthorchis viverrini]KER20800.1 hypothetical protein T265_10738 [Opisthorchis viverrini]